MHLQFRGMYFFFMTKTHTKSFFCSLLLFSIINLHHFFFCVLCGEDMNDFVFRLKVALKTTTISWPIKKCWQNKRYVFDCSLVVWVQGIALSSTFFLPFWQEMMRSWHVCRILSNPIIAILRCLDMFVESNKMVSEHH